MAVAVNGYLEFFMREVRLGIRLCWHDGFQRVHLAIIAEGDRKG